MRTYYSDPSLYRSIKDVPCHGCKDRDPSGKGCHSSCPRYAEYITRVKAAKDQAWAAKIGDCKYEAYNARRQLLDEKRRGKKIK